MFADARMPVAAATLILALSSTAGAHRTDEYLQATRIGVDLHRVTMEIDLTAGVSIAPAVIAAIDTDLDDRISEVEELAYARLVLKSIVLAVDDQPRALALTGRRFPA